MSHSIAIAGAGIAGLALANALKRQGRSVEVFERDSGPEVRSQGYRLTIDRHGWEALASCLSQEQLRLLQATSGVAGKHFSLLDRSGRHLLRLTSSGSSERQVDRQVLRDILLDGVRDEVRFGTAVEKVHSYSDFVTCVLADATCRRASILVGADGTNSAVRRTCFPEARPTELDLVAIYGKTPWTAIRNHAPAPGEGLLALGEPGNALFFTSMVFDRARAIDECGEAAKRLLDGQEDYAMWAVTLTRDGGPGEQDGHEQLFDRALETARKFDRRLARLVEAGDPRSTLFVSLRRSPMSGVGKGRIVLVGDAAHTMPPFGAHGANTALADAACLARNIAQRGTSELALKWFDGEMRNYAPKSVRRAVLQARLVASRNRVLRALLFRGLPIAGKLIGKTGPDSSNTASCQGGGELDHAS